ncbi:MAG TPA: VWA domain-containing protein, partial [Terriglobales bacterium]|nr:VWA domain-containing protein [Terriglobales bacterium]
MGLRPLVCFANYSVLHNSFQTSIYAPGDQKTNRAEVHFDENLRDLTRLNRAKSLIKFSVGQEITVVKRLFRFLSLLAFSCIAVSLVYAQGNISSTTETSQTPVFRSSSRLVLMDVIATDAKGGIVSGLTAKDFTVFEDGKQQKIWGFSAHTDPKTPALSSRPVELPPNQFTNITTAQRFDRPITIILLDTLNTTITDQTVARQEMMKFLKNLPPGERVALFGLSSHLRMVQGFSGDSQALIRAATALMAKSSAHLVTHADREDNAASVDALTAGLDARSAEEVRDTLERAISMEEAFHGEERIETTLQAINALTRAVGGYPGRKTLLWLSADFPFRLGPDFAAHKLEHFMHDYTKEIKQTQSALADAQISVYPIDIRGLATVGFESSSSNNITPGSMHDQVVEMYVSHQAMNDIARETGGEAYYNMNDIRGAMALAVADEARYYTLAYIPVNHDWDGKYRKIEIKAATKGLRLSYRRGYFATEKNELTEDESRQLFHTAMQPYLPEYTLLFMKVKVMPPDATSKLVRIDYAVDAHSVSFSDPGDKTHHAILDFMVTVWDKNNQDVEHAGKTVRAALPPQSYAQVMKTGIPLHQELELKPGTYILRLGVIDRGSQRIGTVDVPLTVSGDSKVEMPPVTD